MDDSSKSLRLKKSISAVMLTSSGLAKDGERSAPNSPAPVSSDRVVKEHPALEIASEEANVRFPRRP